MERNKVEKVSYEKLEEIDFLIWLCGEYINN